MTETPPQSYDRRSSHLDERDPDCRACQDADRYDDHTCEHPGWGPLWALLAPPAAGRRLLVLDVDLTLASRPPGFRNGMGLRRWEDEVLSTDLPAERRALVAVPQLAPRFDDVLCLTARGPRLRDRTVDWLLRNYPCLSGSALSTSERVEPDVRSQVGKARRLFEFCERRLYSEVVVVDDDPDMARCGAVFFQAPFGWVEALHREGIFNLDYKLVHIDAVSASEREGTRE